MNSRPASRGLAGGKSDSLSRWGQNLFESPQVGKKGPVKGGSMAH